MKSITKDAILAAADDLDSRGEKVTQTAVRSIVGGGSFNTIGPVLAEWRDRKAKQEMPHYEPMPKDLTAAAQRFFDQLWQQARVGAEQDLAAHRQRLEEATIEAQEQAKEAIELADSLSAELDRARNRLDELESVERVNADLQVQLAQLKTKTANEIHRAAERVQQKDSEALEANQRERTAIERAARAEGQIDALKEQLARMIKTQGSSASKK